MAIPVTVIINKNARQGEAITNELPFLLEQAGFIADVILISNQELQPALQQAVQAQPPLLIIAGGDGTVGAAVSAVKGTSTTLGIIPAGTTNNLARSLNVPLDYSSAIEVIKQNHTINLTLGHIKLPDKSLNFCTAASIGLSALTIPRTDNNHKRILGRLAYILEGTKHFMGHQAFRCDLDIDHRREAFLTHEIIIANTEHQAGIPLSPEDLKEKPRLALTVLATRHSRLLHIWNFLKLLAGHTHTPSLIQKTIKQATIHVHPPQPLEADGEAIGTYATITITPDPQTATILTPAA